MVVAQLVDDAGFVLVVEVLVSSCGEGGCVGGILEMSSEFESAICDVRDTSVS